MSSGNPPQAKTGADSQGGAIRDDPATTAREQVDEPRNDAQRRETDVGVGSIQASPPDTSVDSEAPVTHAVRRNALFEIVGFLAVFVAVDFAFLGGDGYWEVKPHPFWIIVLFVASQYGSREGLAAAGLSAVALFAGGIPELRLTQDLYAYLFELVYRPLFWSMSAVLLGELRMRQIRERDELRAQLESSRARATTIAAAYEALNDAKSQLEVRVAGQLRTVVSMYKAARAVETMEPGQVLVGAIENVRAVINPQKCSIYLLAGDQLQAGIQHGWGRRDRMKRLFRSDSTLFREIVGKARVVCIADPDDEIILAGQGIMAGPVINPDTGEVRGMIKIEDMGFLDLNLSTVEIFRVLCEWVGAFYANAQRYRRGQQERGVDSTTQLYADSFYPRMERLLGAIAVRAKIPITVLTVRIDEPFRLERTQMQSVAGALGLAVADSLRDTDIAFEHGDGGWEFDVVLPMTPIVHANLVGNRLIGLFDDNLPNDMKGLSVSFTVNMIHDPQAPAIDPKATPATAQDRSEQAAR